MKKKLFVTLLALVCAICCTLGISACDIPDNSGDNGGETVAVESVVLSQSALSLVVNEGSVLTATVLPENATDKTVRWESDKPEIATVDDNGVVTAKAVGTAIITATTANNKTAECSVTVKAKETDILAGKTYDFHDVICTNGDIPLNGFKAGLSNSKVVFANDGTCTVGNEDNNVKYAYSVDGEKVKIGTFEYIMKDDELSYSMQTEPYNVVVIYKLQTEE